MHIRDERPDDASTISQIHYAAFKDHPVHPPGSEPVEHLIVERLQACGDLTLSLVAEEGGKVTGHIAISPAVVGEDKTGWYLLGPVGVLPSLQGKGIGSALVSEALSRMRAMGAAGVVLVGDPSFYTRFGFANVPGLGYPGVPDQYVLAACLGGRAPKGDIAAHEAFSMAAQ
jgi:putative acetyltransferase